MMIPLTMLLRRENLGYKWGPGGYLLKPFFSSWTILKLYGKSLRELDDLVERWLGCTLGILVWSLG